MKNTTNQTFSEVYDVINHMSKEMQEKIPKGFMNLIKDNRDLEYTFNIDYTIDIKKQLLKESKVILSLGPFDAILYTSVYFMKLKFILRCDFYIYHKIHALIIYHKMDNMSRLSADF